MSKIKAHDWLSLNRIVRFGDTDGAGVIHFHNLLRWCHESWEESLDNYGVKAIDIFPSLVDVDRESPLSIAIPITHCEADFFAPIGIGDQLKVDLAPCKLDPTSFQIEYKFQRGTNDVAVACLRHRAINSKTRCRCDLPEGISRWLEASTLNRGISSL